VALDTLGDLDIPSRHDILVSFGSFHESYGALILRRRAQRLRRQTSNAQYYTESERLNGDRSTAAVLMRALTRPLRLLIIHPIIQASATLSGFNYGIMYVTLPTFSGLRISQYHQSVEISGLHYIACALREIAASQVGGRMMDQFYKRRETQNPPPESRMPLTYPGIIAAWIEGLIYGWTTEYRLYWLAVDVGVFIMMFGLQLGGMPSTYRLETFFAVSSLYNGLTNFKCYSYGICYRLVWRVHEQRYGGDTVC
jgi:hypothetical protein